MIASVSTKAMTSDAGNAIQTPSIPKIGGRTATRGIRNSICLDSDRKMLTFALPMDWKKLVTTA